MGYEEAAGKEKQVVLEVLGFRYKEILYGIEFKYIEEVCFGLHSNPTPFLPEYYSGLVNYKGNILPSVRMEKESEDGHISVILHCGIYEFALMLPEEPVIYSLSEEERIEGESGKNIDPFWAAKQLYRKEKDLICIMDMEKICENLVIYK